MSYLIVIHEYISELYSIDNIDIGHGTSLLILDNLIKIKDI